jgi:cytochrome c oxidase subunit 3
LATEVLFFGGMFAVYAVNRLHFSAAFVAGSSHEDLLLGTSNTAILLTSSLAVATATLAWTHKKRVLSVLCLLGAAGMGCAFLGIKAYEYAEKVQHGLLPGHAFTGEPERMELFFSLYFMMTGVHALHLSIGVVVMLVMAARAYRSTATEAQLENSALYWHFVDAMWVILFPLFYLVR